MAALNQTETAALQNAQVVLATVLNEGFDKNSRNERDKWLAREIKKAMTELRDVKTKKGYFPK